MWKRDSARQRCRVVSCHYEGRLYLTNHLRQPLVSWECESENLWTQTAIIKDFTKCTRCKQNSTSTHFLKLGKSLFLLKSTTHCVRFKKHLRSTNRHVSRFKCTTVVHESTWQTVCCSINNQNHIIYFQLSSMFYCLTAFLNLEKNTSIYENIMNVVKTQYSACSIFNTSKL